MEEKGTLSLLGKKSSSSLAQPFWDTPERNGRIYVLILLLSYLKRQLLGCWFVRLEKGEQRISSRAVAFMSHCPKEESERVEGASSAKESGKNDKK